MFFFGKNLKFKHKVTLCLAALGILANVYVCRTKSAAFPFVEFLENGNCRIHVTQCVLSFGIFVKMLMIAFFRKF